MTHQSRDADEFGGRWRHVASAVEYLAELERPGFTVWDALDEAVRWWIVDHLAIDGELDRALIDVPWEDP